MMRTLLVIGCIVALALGQRPPYASKPFVYPDVLPQYQNNATSTTGEGLEQKFGEDTSTTTAKSLPGSIYEQDTINIVSQWPKDKQPFWFVNNQHISNHTGFKPQEPSPGQGQAAPQPQSGRDAGLAERFQSGGKASELDDEKGWLRQGAGSRRRQNSPRFGDSAGDLRTELRFGSGGQANTGDESPSEEDGWMRQGSSQRVSSLETDNTTEIFSLRIELRLS